MALIFIITHFQTDDETGEVTEQGSLRAELIRGMIPSNPPVVLCGDMFRHRKTKDLLNLNAGEEKFIDELCYWLENREGMKALMAEINQLPPNSIVIASRPVPAELGFKGIADQGDLFAYDTDTQEIKRLYES